MSLPVWSSMISHKQVSKNSGDISDEDVFISSSCEE